MGIKINNNGELIDATIEMIDGVMVVSPKVNQDVSQFKDGDVITICYNDGYKITTIFSDFYKRGFNAHATLHSDGEIGICCGSLEFGELNRFATEEEKQKLFKALADEGWEWDVKERKLVKVKWKPKIYEKYYAPLCASVNFKPNEFQWKDTTTGNLFYERGWVFPFTEQGKADCQKLVDKLNEAINSVKI